MTARPSCFRKRHRRAGSAPGDTWAASQLNIGPRSARVGVHCGFDRRRYEFVPDDCLCKVFLQPARRGFLQKPSCSCRCCTMIRRGPPFQDDHSDCIPKITNCYIGPPPRMAFPQKSVSLPRVASDLTAFGAALLPSAVPAILPHQEHASCRLGLGPDAPSGPRRRSRGSHRRS